MQAGEPVNVPRVARTRALGGKSAGWCTARMLWVTGIDPLIKAASLGITIWDTTLFVIPVHIASRRR